MEHCDVYKYENGHWIYGDATRTYVGSKPHDEECARIDWRTYYVVDGPHTDEECPLEERFDFTEN